MVLGQFTTALLVLLTLEFLKIGYHGTGSIHNSPVGHVGVRFLKKKKMGNMTLGQSKKLGAITLGPSTR